MIVINNIKKIKECCITLTHKLHNIVRTSM
jgi:hypothetical protein